MTPSNLAGAVGVSLVVLAGAAQAAGPRDLCPDRPLKGTSACTLDKGYWQVETDLANRTTDTSGSVKTELLVAPNPTMKYGLSDTVDIEASIAPYERQNTSGGGAPKTTVSGPGDLFLKAKWHVSGENGQDGVALVPYVKVPTAKGALGNGAWEFGLIAPWQTSLPGDWSLDVTAEVDALKDAMGSGRHAAASLGAGFSHLIAADITGGIELWAQSNFEPAASVHQASLDFALSWQPKGAPFAIDGGVNLGLNSQTPDKQLYLGLSRRF